jgi:starvation-inducible DNA-binding protein
MKDMSLIKPVPQKLATPTDFTTKAKDAITMVINPLVADAFSLYVKTKNFHWHMSGSHYRDYHLLLDEHADQIFAMIDVLAERVRKVGGLTIRSIDHIKSLQHIQDDNETFVKPQEMLKRLMDDNKLFAHYLRSAHKVCGENNDFATTSILENYMDETERRIWFLYETISD